MKFFSANLLPFTFHNSKTISKQVHYHHSYSFFKYLLMQQRLFNVLVQAYQIPKNILYLHDFDKEASLTLCLEHLLFGAQEVLLFQSLPYRVWEWFHQPNHWIDSQMINCLDLHYSETLGMQSLKLHDSVHLFFLLSHLFSCLNYLGKS